MYVSEIVGSMRRGRPVIRWKDRVKKKKLLIERKGLNK